ncbi:nucleotidyltransferase domain-containing protein [Candidatus Woesearchaeota archaeon]|nr:nucleotidyltransferase domain-containing protein [Candidatus Woesearchaeota archaeon]
MLRFLKENKNTRKIFGKKELKIIEEQLIGINLTQSEKNRLSRDIRPKFEFIKECSRFSDNFKLKKGAETKEKIQEAKEEILNDKLRNNIKQIILFGSFVKKEFMYDSDVDIAVKFKKELNLREATLFRKRVLGRVADQMDIQVFENLPKKIQEDINKTGKIIFQI